jgi:hypothetical protein
MRRASSLILLVLAVLSRVAPAAWAGEAPFCELYAVGPFGN